MYLHDLYKYRGVSRIFFHQGQISIYRGTLPPLKKFCHWGIIHKRGWKIFNLNRSIHLVQMYKSNLWPIIYSIKLFNETESNIFKVYLQKKSRNLLLEKLCFSFISLITSFLFLAAWDHFYYPNIHSIID